MIVRVRVVFRKTVVGDCCFNYLSGSHLQSQVKMTTIQVVETSVTNDSLSKDYPHPDDHAKHIFPHPKVTRQAVASSTHGSTKHQVCLYVLNMTSTDDVYMTHKPLKTLPQLLTCTSCVAVTLSSGLFTRHLDTKSRNSSDHFSGSLNVGGGFVGIIKIACWNKGRH